MSPSKGCASSTVLLTIGKIYYYSRSTFSSYSYVINNESKSSDPSILNNEKNNYNIQVGRIMIIFEIK